jgi:hypothetical protein
MLLKMGAIWNKEESLPYITPSSLVIINNKIYDTKIYKATKYANEFLKLKNRLITFLKLSPVSVKQYSSKYYYVYGVNRKKLDEITEFDISTLSYKTKYIIYEEKLGTFKELLYEKHYDSDKNEIRIFLNRPMYDILMEISNETDDLVKKADLEVEIEDIDLT